NLMTDEDLSMKYVVAHDLLNTKHLFCLYHLSQNIIKNLRSKLGEQYADFIKDFYLACNSLSESACAYTFKIFTGRMQSIQRVEKLNNHIKTAINSLSTLSQVMEAIQQQVTYDNDFIENIYDVLQSYLLALIKENEYSSIKEVWKITCLISTNILLESNFARFYIMLLPIRWCKDDVTESERAQELFITSNRNTELALITHQLSNATSMNLFRVDNIQENNFQKSVDKKLQFTKSMSLVKWAIILQDDNRKIRILRENYSLGNVIVIEIDNDQLISINDIANSLYHIGKGAPKKNRIKGAQEEYQPKKKPNQVQAQDF
ncbi:34111_t:CDS:2, partial [Gigaspora margarita]